MEKQKRINPPELMGQHQFDIAHLDIMDVRDLERTTVLELEGFRERLAIMGEKGVISSTFTYDGRIICCGGFYEIWDGVAEGWIIPSIHVKKCRKVFFRTVKMWVDRIMKEFRLHRLQSCSYADDSHDSWMRHLGFECEGVKRKFGPDGQDYRMYARVN